MARDEAYQAAEREIAEAIQTGSTFLDLSRMKLTELPQALQQLSSLTSLDISENNLSELPEWLGQFSQLKYLYPHENQLTTLPSSLGDLRNLEVLYAYKNSLTMLPDSLGQLKALRRLSFFSNRLTSLPSFIKTFDKLQDLSISYNELRVLPDWIGNLTQLEELHLMGNPLATLPQSLGNLIQLKALSLPHLSAPPNWIFSLHALRELAVPASNMESLEWLGRLVQLEYLFVYSAQPGVLPASLNALLQLKKLIIYNSDLATAPEWIGSLVELRDLDLSGNQLISLPEWLDNLPHLQKLNLDDNPLNPELAAAYAEGFPAVKQYLRAKAGPQITLNEAKLILVGEGEVGKSCLLSALRDDPWEEGKPTTHGIEIKPVTVTDPRSGTEYTLNGWDFGGQRVYRPTHQLFFSAPAVYLVVWKPREGTQQGLVKEWIQLVKHREPDAKILVVATHGGPGQRQPDLDRQEIWDLFTQDMVVDFFFVDSKPDENGTRSGIADLKIGIAKIVAGLPEVGRKVPARWQNARDALKKTGAPYLPLNKVLEICRDGKLKEEEGRLFLRISHRLGHLIYYSHDPLLRDIVILKPDWLSTAMSFVLDDKQTREAHGLVSFARLGELWSDPTRTGEFRYSPDLHPIFLRLMERFDLSYRVAEPHMNGVASETSLVAQLVPDVRPDLSPQWAKDKGEGDEQQVQICRIVDGKTGQSAPAEGLFYQLIVRLHKYSLGRKDYNQSVHWQRGLLLDDDYNGRALLENVGTDVRITVRAPYPERFLSVLTHEVKWLVESFWAGLRCDVMVPCIEPCGRKVPGTGLFEVQKLIESKKSKRPEFPCNVCNEWQSIDVLLRNAPAAQRTTPQELISSLSEMKSELSTVRPLLLAQHGEIVGRFDQIDIGVQRILSKVDDAFSGLMHALTDEAKEGPRLFSFRPIEPGFFDRPKWMSEKFELTLWCERSRLPLPSLNEKGDKRGVYQLTLPRDWFVKAAPFLKVLTATLSLALPVASAATKLVLDDFTYKGIEKELELGQKSIEAGIKGGDEIGAWLAQKDTPDVERGDAIRAQGAILRQLHSWLKEKDPSFGGLVRVQNKRQEFLWVHKRFETEY
jgi:Leucine-rich repeat (LRR) protein